MDSSVSDFRFKTQLVWLLEEVTDQLCMDNVLGDRRKRGWDSSKQAGEPGPRGLRCSGRLPGLTWHLSLTHIPPHPCSYLFPPHSPATLSTSWGPSPTCQPLAWSPVYTGAGPHMCIWAAEASTRIHPHVNQTLQSIIFKIRVRCSNPRSGLTMG